MIKYIKSVLWRVAKLLSYIEDAWCLKVNPILFGRNYLELVFNLHNDVAPGIFGTQQAVCARRKLI